MVNAGGLGRCNPGLCGRTSMGFPEGGGDWVVGLQKGTTVTNDRVLLLGGGGIQGDRVLLHGANPPEVVYGRVGQVGQR